MRLWHYKLLKFLPKSQLLAQWRELNSIFKKQDKHILINYVYEYSNSELYMYSILVIKEMENRGYKIKSFDNMKKFFEIENIKDTWFYLRYDNTWQLFKNHHNDRYLLQCFFNLQEKYDRGQKDFTDECYNGLRELVNEKFDLTEFNL